MAIEISVWLHPLGEDNPCGKNLEYAPEFQALDVAVDQGDWKAARGLGEALCDSTRDLRVAVHLARAWLALEGLAGFADGVRLVRAWLETFWEPLYPELEDPEEGLPLTRVNVLSSLASIDQNPSKLHLSTPTLLRNAAIVQSGVLGSFSFREYQLAAGDISLGDDAPEADRAVDLGKISAAYQSAGPAANRAMLDTVQGILGDLRAVSGLFDSRLRPGIGPNFDTTTLLLDAMAGVIRKYGEVEVAGEPQPGPAVATASAAVAVVSGGVPGTIGNRQDAVLALERVCEYFERQEPSSPVPLLLRRAKRLVSKSFMEVLEDLTPDAVATAQQIVGQDRE